MQDGSKYVLQNLMDTSTQDGTSTPQRAVSPTGSLSSLFDGSSGGGGATAASSSSSSTTKVDHFLDSVLENSNSSVVLQTPPKIRPTPPRYTYRPLAQLVVEVDEENIASVLQALVDAIFSFRTSETS